MRALASHKCDLYSATYVVVGGGGGGGGRWGDSDIKMIKSITGCVLCCLKLVPLRSKNIFKPRLSNKILVPLRVFFKNF